ncbi:MAG: hypothetical protein L0Y38_07830 [Methylococcaceae bacterium]|nr:hypothetical protein [Methylococcaceae bacterium]
MARIGCFGIRDRIFTPLLVLQSFLFQVLSADGSCKPAVARVLTGRLQQEQPPNTVNTAPYCKARKRLPLAPLKEAVAEIGQKLHQPKIQSRILGKIPDFSFQAKADMLDPAFPANDHRVSDTGGCPESA